MKTLYVSKSGIDGRGVFATCDFRRGEEIMVFTGPIVHKSRVPKNLFGRHDHYMQVSPTQFMGPSYGPDDFMNHSCDPNAGHRFKGPEVHLIAIRRIKKGEEITWDYSTTLHNNKWKMKCKCGSKKCRGVIREFSSLPERVKRRYRRLRLIPPYLRVAIRTHARQRA